MLLGNDDQWDGQNVADIKAWGTCGRGGTKDEYTDIYKEKKREIARYNKVARQLHKTNPEITTQFNNHRTDNIGAFIKRIIAQVEAGRYNADQIGQIVENDNGSRGLARTMHMQLFDTEGNILDVSNEYQYKYYYM